jgi:hypothetical protein
LVIDCAHFTTFEPPILTSHTKPSQTLELLPSPELERDMLLTPANLSVFFTWPQCGHEYLRIQPGETSRLSAALNRARG